MTKHSKKIAMVLFVVLMTAVMAACGNKATDEKEDNALELVKMD